MRLIELRIKNFRCYKEEFSITFNALTAIIAKNDIGKSTVLEALDAFFNLDKLDADDRSSGLRNTDSIEFTCIFADVPDEIIVDTDNSISPYEEYLLNSNNYLEVKKIFSGATPKCENVLLKAFHPQAENFNDLFSLTIAGLRSRAQILDIELTSVIQTIKSSIRHAIWSSVATALNN